MNHKVLHFLFILLLMASAATATEGQMRFSTLLYVTTGDYWLNQFISQSHQVTFEKYISQKMKDEGIQNLTQDEVRFAMSQAYIDLHSLNTQSPSPRLGNAIQWLNSNAGPYARSLQSLNQTLTMLQQLHSSPEDWLNYLGRIPTDQLKLLISSQRFNPPESSTISERLIHILTSRAAGSLELFGFWGRDIEDKSFFRKNTHLLPKVVESFSQTDNIEMLCAWATMAPLIEQRYTDKDTERHAGIDQSLSALNTLLAGANRHYSKKCNYGSLDQETLGKKVSDFRRFYSKFVSTYAIHSQSRIQVPITNTNSFSGSCDYAYHMKQIRLTIEQQPKFSYATASTDIYKCSITMVTMKNLKNTTHVQITILTPKTIHYLDVDSTHDKLIENIASALGIRI